MRSESTRATIVGLFALTDRAELSASELVALAAPAGVTASNLKSHLTRLVEEGVLLRQGTPRAFLYSPSRSRGHVIATIKARMRGDAETWTGEWIAALLSVQSTRSERERTQRRLRFDGFRPWGPRTFVRPAWPRAWALERARTHAGSTGLVLVGRVEEGEAGELYELDGLDRRATSLAKRLLAAVARIRTPRAALAERLKQGEPVARLFAEDPHLPRELWGGRTGLRSLADAYARFERVLEPMSRVFVAEVLAARVKRASAARLHEKGSNRA